MRGPLDSEVMRGFVEGLEPMNSLAERSPGFIWRLQTDEGDATALRVFDDDRILFNMSVWESVETLQDYIYRSDHGVPYRRRDEWFFPPKGPNLVLWWVPRGHEPTVSEGKQKLEQLAEHGPSAEAFTFQRPFPSPATP